MGVTDLCCSSESILFLSSRFGRKIAAKKKKKKRTFDKGYAAGITALPNQRPAV
jgi:hypothetical protein